MSILLPTNKVGHIVLPLYAFAVERLLKSPKSTLNAPVSSERQRELQKEREKERGRETER